MVFNRLEIQEFQYTYKKNGTHHNLRKIVSVNVASNPLNDTRYDVCQCPGILVHKKQHKERIIKPFQKEKNIIFFQMNLEKR